jgi:serine/threonine protein phosphatase 1
MLYAVGDIHGTLDKLDELLGTLPLEAGDEVVFLGDYVDRGPNARGVVDRLIAFSRDWPCTFLIGNHESMFLDYVGWTGEYYDKGEYFLANGGIETLLSYGVRDFEAVERAGMELPPEHARFFRELVPYHRSGDYLFVHAGLGVPELGLSDVDCALERARPSDLLWNRMSGDLRHLLGVTLVYGHSPDPTLRVRWNTPYSIGIDTGAVYGGPLTAIALPSERLFQVGDEGGPGGLYR